jgi:extradiol dioxygenase family protein
MYQYLIFGCLLDIAEFKNIKERLESEKIDFIVKPQKRYEGKAGEQLTMFIFDLSGNPIEFKAFSNEDEVFSNYTRTDS